MNNINIGFGGDLYNVERSNNKMTPMEIEEVTTRTKAASLEEKKYMVSVIPTELLINELKRRDHVMDTMVDYIVRFSDYISSVEDATEREKNIAKFRKVMAKGGVVNALPIRDMQRRRLSVLLQEQNRQNRPVSSYGRINRA